MIKSTAHEGAWRIFGSGMRDRGKRGDHGKDVKTEIHGSISSAKSGSVKEAEL